MHALNRAAAIPIPERQRLSVEVICGGVYVFSAFRFAAASASVTEFFLRCRVRRLHVGQPASATFVLWLATHCHRPSRNTKTSRYLYVSSRVRPWLGPVKCSVNETTAVSPRTSTRTRPASMIRSAGERGHERQFLRLVTPAPVAVRGRELVGQDVGDETDVPSMERVVPIALELNQNLLVGLHVLGLNTSDRDH